jgi:hypothetical protein
MVFFVGKHAVKDFESWKNATKGAISDPERNAEWGILDSAMHRSLDGSAIVTHKFATVEAAQKYKQMMLSPESKSFRDSIGIIDPITIWIGEEI